MWLIQSCCANEARASIVQDIEWVQFVLQNCQYKVYLKGWFTRRQIRRQGFFLLFRFPFRQRNASCKLPAT